MGRISSEASWPLAAMIVRLMPPSTHPKVEHRNDGGAEVAAIDDVSRFGCVLGRVGLQHAGPRGFVQFRKQAGFIHAACAGKERERFLAAERTAANHESVTIENAFGMQEIAQE
jgi:hypothetical protein